jgi:phage gpG-like protein
MAAMPGTIEVRMEVLGEVQLHRRLDGMIDRVQDLRPAFERIAAHLERTFEQAFASSGATGGTGVWTPLSPRYAAWKLRKVGPKPILTFSGRLRRSMTQSRARGAVREILPLEMRFGTSVVVGRRRRWNLGALHQTGTRRGLPVRKVIALTPRQRAGITRAIRDHIWAEP